MAVSRGKNWILSSISKKSLDDIRRRRVYGRRIGKPLKKHSMDALNTLLPVLSIPEDSLSEAADLDPFALFEKAPRACWMEIGFGNGAHLAALMRKYPDIGFIGAEPFQNGMAYLLKDIAGEKNLRVLMDDAMKCVHSLKDNTLERIYVLNPDPWPKKRHHKRRIISQPNLDAFARILKSGGELIMATDVDGLAEWMVTQASIHHAFTWTAQTSADWKNPPSEWIMTRYAEKGIAAGRKQSFLVFRRC
jgi:tRNA (guanine-N7-)-methyltransferase